MAIDFDSRFGRRASHLLKRQTIIWLTSVDRRGQPQPRPVWFHWDGSTVLVFSQPKTGKLRQIALHPRVSLHFNSDELGSEVVVLLGRARRVSRPLPAMRVKAYLRKYRRGIEDLGMTPEAFHASYSVPIVIRPTRLRGY